ncbi:MAG: GNAT family N-acetyltransferase [Nitrososphaeria archaeon]
MNSFKIKDVEKDEVDSFIYLCISPEKRENRFIIEGINAKRSWAIKSIDMFGSIAKIAYIDSKPVGMIQYRPQFEERIVEIRCIFVPDKEYTRRGIGRALLKELIVDMKKPKKFFNNRPAQALVTWAFKVPGYYPQNEFYLKMGFKKVEEDNPFLLYYPLAQNYIYRPKKEEYKSNVEDKGKALIFYDPSCPFCIYFAEQIKSLILEVAPNIPIRLINIFEQPEEVKKRGKVQNCVVNGRAILTFFMDKENFKKEVNEALK